MEIKYRFTSGTGPVSSAEADEELVDRRDRAAAPDPELDDLGRGDAQAGQRPDGHMVDDRNGGLSWREAEQELLKLRRLPIGSGCIPRSA